MFRSQKESNGLSIWKKMVTRTVSWITKANSSAYICPLCSSALSSWPYCFTWPKDFLSLSCTASIPFMDCSYFWWLKGTLRNSPSIWWETCNCWWTLALQTRSTTASCCWCSSLWSWAQPAPSLCIIFNTRRRSSIWLKPKEGISMVF